MDGSYHTHLYSHRTRLCHQTHAPNYLTRGPQLEIVARPRAVIDDYQLLLREAELSGSSGSAGAQASDDDESPLARRVRAYE